MSRTDRVYSILLAAIFFCFIISPLFLFLLLPLKETSEVEKRKLAIFPEIKKINSILFFQKKFEKFYQDHFGLRDNLVKLNNLISLFVFNKTPSPFVLKGKEGWFFYTGEGVLQDYFGQQQADAVYLEKYISMFSDRRDWLNSLGIRYLFVPIPNKITVYDEQLPEKIKQSRMMTFYEQFMNNVNHRPISKNIIDVYKLFNDAKKKHQVYLKTDTHWSHYGAISAFNEIVKRCNVFFQQRCPEKLSDEEIIRSNINYSGDLTMMMHLEADISEDASILQIKNKCSGPDKNLSSYYSALLPSNPYVTYIVNGCEKQGLTTLILHDSFGGFLHKFFNERFKKTFFLPGVQFNEAKKFILKKKPDIVIEVWVARNMRKIVADPEVTATVLEKQYARSDKVALNTDDLLNFSRIKNKNDIVLIHHGQEIFMESSGNDPYFSVPFHPDHVGINGHYVVEVKITAPEDTEFALYFTTAEAPDTFTEQQKVEEKIHKGKNRLLFRLPHPHVAGMIRIDPGKKAGKYVLHSLTIKAVSEQTAADAAFQPENSH